MKYTNLTCIALMTLFAALAIPAGLAAQEQAERKLPRYVVTDLGTLGGTFSAGRGINNHGIVIGNSSLTGDTAQHAFIWRSGLKTDLGTLGGPNSNAFLGPNERGIVAGEAETSTPDPLGEDFCFFGTQLICLPFIWQNGGMTVLPTLGGDNGAASDINNLGQVGGLAENSTLDSTCPTAEYQVQAVIWDKGVPKALPTVAGDPDGYINAINNNGQAVGGSGDCFSGQTFSLHALLWRNNEPTDLGSLGGALFSGGVGINDRGLVIGTSDLPGDINFWAFPFINAHAFAWKSGAITDLGTLPGDATSFAEAVNDGGQVVGLGSRAILWQNGVPTDLNALVPGPPFSPLYLLQAFDINARGEITGLGLAITGEFHAFLATPCNQDEANVEGCKNVDATVSEELIQPSATMTPVPMSQRDTVLGSQIGRMLHRSRVPQSREHQLPFPGNGPTR